MTSPFLVYQPAEHWGFTGGHCKDWGTFQQKRGLLVRSVLKSGHDGFGVLSWPRMVMCSFPPNMF